MDPEPSFFLQYTLDTNLALGFIAIFALLFCSALISGAEVALFSLSQKDIDDTLTAFEVIREKLVNGTYKKIAAETTVDVS